MDGIDGYDAWKTREDDYDDEREEDEHAGA
jgi:hypothetical protein